MSHLSPSLQSLIDELKRLPGVGRKTAQRLAFHLLRISRDEALSLSSAISKARELVKNCSICYNFTETDPCQICQNGKRDHSSVCVVEQPSDVLSLESTAVFAGIYHVLGGALSPLDGIGPEDLRISQLLKRLKAGGIEEVIIATNPNAEGEATALYLSNQIRPLGVKVTRIARGLPVGSDLQYADEVTLRRALEGRREL